jgi:hypothetical protein
MASAPWDRLWSDTSLFMEFPMTGGVAWRFVLALVPLLGGCALLRPQAAELPSAQVEVVENKVPLGWREVATPADQERLDHAAEAWNKALAAAARFRTAIRTEGALLDPDIALPRAAPSPGTYQCRVVRLGGRPALESFRPFACFVEAEGELLTMVKATGSQRPAGRLWTDSDTRLVFLGGLAAPDAEPPPYGADAATDVAGWLERIGPFRWRLAVPYPQGGAVLDVYELTPLIPARP